MPAKLPVTIEQKYLAQELSHAPEIIFGLVWMTGRSH
jgi:hypothetical protein